MNIFSGLVELGREWEIIPDVAQSWEISEDGCKYIFHLRDDVYWSDGEPVTAADFEYAWKYILNPANDAPLGLASLLYEIKGARAYHLGEISASDQVGVRAINVATLDIELERPVGYFLHLLTILYPVPQHLVETYGDGWAAPGNIVSNGPFLLESHMPGESITLRRNPTHHGRFPGNLGTVEVNLSVSHPDALAKYQSNIVDVVRLFEETYSARIYHIEDYISFPVPATYCVVFDVSRPPFDDLKVRRAFVMSIDREKLANEILLGYQYPASGGYVPPGMPGHSPDIALPYDPEQARQQLAQAGYPKGKGFPKLELITRSLYQKSLEYLAAQWLSNLNVETSIEILDRARFFDEASSKNLFINGWFSDYPDPDSNLRVSVRQHAPHWKNETYDRLLKKARHSLNQSSRIPLYQAADKILMEEAVIMPLAYARYHWLVKPWVKSIGGGFDIYSLKDVILEPH